MRKIGSLVLLPLLALTAAAQQKKPWQKQPCIEHPGWCGIIVTFNPPINDALLVPNEVTVDVPLELQPTEVSLETYPLGTEVADQPHELLADMSRFEKTGNYARFHAVIEKCPEKDGGLKVSVVRKKFKQYPLKPWGGALDCRQMGYTTTRQPPPTK